ncbi:MAG: hypothetical protein QOH58_3514 [Thermoleophilaceae bacterium]|nr:hypothetical protein [Thermoleophilaceae bacterium]
MARHGTQALIGPDLAAFLEQGVAVIAATGDERMQPDITRGWGPHASADGRELTLSLSTPPGSKSRANLSDPTPEQQERIEAHIAMFVEQAQQIGMSASMSARMLVPPFATVACAVRELYDQTPGAGA